MKTSRIADFSSRSNINYNGNICWEDTTFDPLPPFVPKTFGNHQTIKEISVDRVKRLFNVELYNHNFSFGSCTSQSTSLQYLSTFLGTKMQES